MINSLCELVTAKKRGCCYEQDKRPKYHSRSTRYRDRFENLPMLAHRASYMDGEGKKSNKTVCYTDYCPDCQQYWAMRIQGLPSHVPYMAPGLFGVRNEPIAPGETLAQVIDRVVQRTPGARFLENAQSAGILRYQTIRA
jgi:hypothetical protein